jgi:ferredoxin
MARRINDERCIVCGVCISECPNGGITEVDGAVVIDSSMCTECFGFNDASRCAAICPVGAVETDPDVEQDEDVLIGRSADLHPDRFPRG